jgi:recombination protein RecR
MDLPSKLLEKTVEHFETLPGVGRRTAMRYALHLLKLQPKTGVDFGNSIQRLVTDLTFCSICHNIADNDICQVCAHPKRDKSTICVVEDLRDLLAIESTSQYYGVYHVLGGVISPMDGVSPSDLHIESLVLRANDESMKEIIFALPSTMEGDTTCFYLYKKLTGNNYGITSLSRGVAIGNDLQYTDEVTLGRSIISRLPYESTFKTN